jgi:hypothetical protein
MNKPILRDPLPEDPPAASEPRQSNVPIADGRPEAEMARVLGTTPFHMALDASGAGIAHWKHEPLHDVVAPMTHHVIMAYNGSIQRMERRSGRSVAIGTFRPGVVIIIPEGSSSRWDIPKPVDVVQLYLPHTILERVAREADTATPTDLLERTAHPDPTTSRLLLTAADAMEGNGALDALFRHQLTDLLATRLLAAHTGSPAAFQPTMGGCRRRSWAAPSNACARIAMTTSPSLHSLRMPACRASTSAEPSRKAPGFRPMPGCASTGSSRRCRCCATPTHRSSRSQRHSAMPPRPPLPLPSGS